MTEGWTATHQKVITPPNTQKRSVAPTLLVLWMMDDGVEKMPAPMTRLMMRNAVDHVPSFRSVMGVLARGEERGEERLRRS